MVTRISSRMASFIDLTQKVKVLMLTIPKQQEITGRAFLKISMQHSCGIMAECTSLGKKTFGFSKLKRMIISNSLILNQSKFGGMTCSISQAIQCSGNY